MEGTLKNLWDVVRRIPIGKVLTYGDAGACLRNPATGFQVGRWMPSAPDGVPWWRVVAKDGSLPIAKTGPGAAQEQAARLREEGVQFLGDGRVDMSRCLWDMAQAHQKADGP